MSYYFLTLCIFFLFSLSLLFFVILNWTQLIKSTLGTPPSPHLTRSCHILRMKLNFIPPIFHPHIVKNKKNVGIFCMFLPLFVPFLGTINLFKIVLVSTPNLLVCVCAHPHLIEHVPPFALRPPHPHQSNSMEIFDLFYILFLSSWFTCSSPSSSTHCPLHRQHLCLFCCLNIGGPSIDVIYIPLPTILLSND